MRAGHHRVSYGDRGLGATGLIETLKSEMGCDDCDRGYAVGFFLGSGRLFRSPFCSCMRIDSSTVSGSPSAKSVWCWPVCWSLLVFCMPRTLASNMPIRGRETLAHLLHGVRAALQ